MYYSSHIPDLLFYSYKDTLTYNYTYNKDVLEFTGFSYYKSHPNKLGVHRRRFTEAATVTFELTYKEDVPVYASIHFVFFDNELVVMDMLLKYERGSVPDCYPVSFLPDNNSKLDLPE